jgi:hypothetical protein
MIRRHGGVEVEEGEEVGLGVGLAAHAFKRLFKTFVRCGVRLFQQPASFFSAEASSKHHLSSMPFLAS